MNARCSSWRTVALGDLGDVVSGGTPSRANVAYWNGDIPWVTPSEITKLKGKYVQDTDEHITRLGMLSSAARPLPPHSVLITTRATLGALAIAAVTVTTNQGFKSLRLRSDFDPLFTYYQLHRCRPEMYRLASGTTFLELSRSDFGRIQAHFPKHVEQLKIAQLLDLTDSAIEKVRASIAKARCVRKGLIHDLLNDGIDSSKMNPLMRSADIRFSSVDKKNSSGETPVRLCNYTDVYKHTYITAHMPFMAATATQPEINRFGLRVGDVIITKDSETPNDIGVPAVVDESAPDLVCGYHLALIRPKLDEIDPLFLVMQLGHDRLRRYFGQQANGTTRYGLSSRAIEQAPIFDIPVEEQARRSDVLREHDRAAFAMEAELTKLRMIKEGLMEDLLSGRVPVPVPEQDCVLEAT